MLRLGSGKKGFTLLEILIVAAAIAILILIAIPLFSTELEKSKRATCDANCNIVARECTYEIIGDSGSSPSEMVNSINQFVDNAFPLVDGKRTQHGKDLCPDGGAYVVLPQIAAKSGNEGTTAAYVVRVICLTHTGRGDWAIGTTYSVGDTMTSNGFVFRCIRAHTSGTTSRTRNPSLRSNKSTWEVIGYTTDPPRTYSSTVRYAQGVPSVYKGSLYYRSTFNLVGGQVPYDDPPRTSDYWIYSGPAPVTP